MSRYHYFLNSILVVIGVYGIATAYDYGIASLNFYNVKNNIEKWHADSHDSALIPYLRAKNNSLVANKYHPNNALYLDLMAQVDEWGVIFEFENEAEGLNSAKQRYLKATQLRPLWPVTWASLVKVKWRLQEFDDEMLYFIERAHTLGPKKAEVSILIADLGLALYTNNHPMLFKIRPIFYERLAQGLFNPLSRDAIRNVIKNYDAESLVCRWLRDKPNATKWLPSKCK
ncbi:VpsP family polysaccharide biosynthesis protein [Flavobacterium sp. W21_SRS_FM6]|uniref:VpsP family polysaccharide biosynthesis protein n=1 Tax=Flavobacterium sp. W21_SRS_FM6 TaxID=3240268 RepID=UPI003F932D53